MKPTLQDFKAELFTFLGMCAMIIGLSPAIVAQSLVGACMVFIGITGLRLVLILRQLPTT